MVLTYKPNKMKSFIKITAIIAAILSFSTGCSKDEPIAPLIIGQWQGTSTGFDDVNFYVEFKKNGTFEKYLQTNGAPYSFFEGTYSIDEEKDIISGEYSNSEPWGADYAISISGKSMTWSVKIEGHKITHVFSKAKIPSEVKESCQADARSASMCVNPVF